MKTESEIYDEIKRLRKCVRTRQECISSTYVDSESKIIYRNEIKEIENDIRRLEWVLGY